MAQPDGRRDLSAERRQEILEAFKRCIARHGLEASSMRRVAAEAGVSQPLLMHYFGSRAGMVEAVVDHTLAAYDEALARCLETVAEEQDPEALLAFLYGDGFAALATRDHGFFPELLAAGVRDPRTRELLHGVYRGLQALLAGHLRKLHPEASPADCRRVAYGLMCLLESNELYRELELPGRRSRDALELSRELVASLARRPR